MPVFFVDELSDTAVIFGEDARHIASSLRMRPGDALNLCDGKNRFAQGTIVSLSKDAVTVRLGQSMICSSEPSVFLSLYVCTPKADKSELIVQKAIELGVGEVVLVLCERCVSRPGGADAVKKISRLQRIARETCMQSGRGRIISVRGILSFEQALNEMRSFDASYLLYEGECPPLSRNLPKNAKRIALLSGSEGGFSTAEVERAAANNIAVVSLGRRILRCETAPIAAAAALMFSLGEME
jgi:16S rRNA (uracil1498-N3)-methyltransferase